MLYGLETVALTKRQEAEMKMAELKMLRFSLGVTKWTRSGMSMLHQRNSTVGTVLRETTRGKTEVVWTPTEERSDIRYIGRRMLRM